MVTRLANSKPRFYKLRVSKMNDLYFFFSRHSLIIFAQFNIPKSVLKKLKTFVLSFSHGETVYDGMEQAATSTLNISPATTKGPDTVETVNNWSRLYS